MSNHDQSRTRSRRLWQHHLLTKKRLSREICHGDVFQSLLGPKRHRQESLYRTISTGSNDPGTMNGQIFTTNKDTSRFRWDASSLGKTWQRDVSWWPFFSLFRLMLFSPKMYKEIITRNQTRKTDLSALDEGLTCVPHGDKETEDTLSFPYIRRWHTVTIEWPPDHVTKR